MFAYCNDMPGVTEEMAGRVNDEVGGAPLPGLIAHVAGPYAGGWRIIDVWESQELADRFQAERLGPAVMRATAGLPVPPVPFDFRVVTGVATQERRAEEVESARQVV